MNTHRLPLLLSSLLLAACSNVVITSGGSGESSSAVGNLTMGGNGGSGVGGSAGTGPAQPTLPAIALTRAQQDVLWEQYWSTHAGSSGGAGGGPALDPNDLFLRASDQGVSCGSPTTHLSCGGHWELSLELPPALQQVGVYDLQTGFMSETGAFQSSDPNDCGWSGGTAPHGTFEILSIDATAVHFRVTAIDGAIWDTDPSGEFTAPRCP